MKKSSRLNTKKVSVSSKKTINRTNNRTNNKNQRWRRIIVISSLKLWQIKTQNKLFLQFWLKSSMLSYWFRINANQVIQRPTFVSFRQLFQSLTFNSSSTCHSICWPRSSPFLFNAVTWTSSFKTSASVVYSRWHRLYFHSKKKRTSHIWFWKTFLNTCSEIKSFLGLRTVT